MMSMYPVPPRASRPLHGTCRSIVTLIVLGALIVLSSDQARAQYALQFGASVEASDGHVLVGEGRNLLLPGSVFVHEVDQQGHWEQVAELRAWDVGEDADGFGRSIAVHGDVVFVGAPEVQRVFVFRRTPGGEYVRHQVVVGEGDGFGGTISASDGTLAVGIPGGRADLGSVALYEEREGEWQQVASLVPSDTTKGTGFGATLAIGEGLLVVGSPAADQRAGLVHVFARSGMEWENEGAVLRMPASADNDRFGSAVAVAAGQVAVGVPGRDRQMGAVAVFRRDDDSGSWVFQKRLTAPVSQQGSMFGTAVASGQDGLFVGAPGFGDREGIVYRYHLEDASGEMTSTLHPEALQYRSSFGGAIASRDGLVVVGATGHDNFEGAAFPYVSNGTMLREGDPLVNDSGQFASITGGVVECSEGAADTFGCADVDMISFLSRSDVGAKRGIQVNDVWGWEDPQTGGEYAIVGRTDGTSFINLTDPFNPVYLGDLPMTETANQSIWRDVKVYKNHAFIVSDGAGAHHMQIFDLTQLRNVANPPATFEVTALYKGVYSSHNIVINEETGFAYAVGSDSGGETCGGALHMINIQDPVNPTFAGCFADIRTGRGTGATHDAQCVLYRGPDADYTGREICLSSNGSALSIADVTDKENPRAISIAEYPNVAYTHQGWLTDDHRYFYLNDEGDEVSNLVTGTRTLILDLADLDDPIVASEYVADHNSIDHNLYVKGNLMYQTNYSAGLRLLDISDPENPVEVGHFDTVPYGKNDNSPVLGAWSSYPYFKSGVIVVTSGREGVFFLKKRPVDI